jgi:hypothetical protein
MVDVIKIAPEAEAQWGHLVKTWATGESRFPNPENQRSVDVSELQPPRDLADVIRQLALIGIAGQVEIPKSIKGVAVMQYSPSIMALRLPPKEMVKEAERLLSGEGEEGVQAYTVPQFYSEFAAGGEMDPLQKLRLHACRIGEYAVSSCM